jgi:soluble lytic murein transglycosylase-like protein
MIRLALPSGSPSGPSFHSTGPVVRVGRSAGCDLRFDGDRHPEVSFHHAELVLEDGRWLVADADSDGGVYLNGRRVTREAIRPGDRIAFGQGGPEVRVEAADARAAPGAAEENGAGGLDALRQQTYRDLAEGARHQEGAPEEEEGRPLEDMEKRSAARMAEEVARKVAEQRALAGGQSSGQTMFIMADALEQADQLARRKSRRKWLKVVSAVGVAALLVTGGMGVVIVRQKQQIDALIEEKQRIDEEILAIHEQMRLETDEAVLAALEERLEILTGKAVSKLDELGKSDEAAAAAEMAEGDELDRDIRAVLKKFNAETYSVPPVFKERLQFHIDKLLYRRNMKLARARKAKYWPIISRAFAEHQLPEELGYIAYVESTFDPDAFHPKVAATGMWQFIARTARENGLQVDENDPAKDERRDPQKSTEAAAKYLVKLMSDFGEESFLLVIASYNMGEDRVRNVLRKVALKEAGGFRKRDFWHLYRLKLLPEETREYVPAVIASAIVLGNPERYADRATGAEDAPVPQ